MGSRLGNPFPKPLTILKNGKSIMGMQIENITTHYDIDDINVVVGFKKNLIMERFPELTYIYNPFFDRTNTSKSLLRALKKNKDKSVLWFNGDVVFDLPKGYVGVKMIEQLFDLIHDEIQEDYWNMRLQFDGIYGYPQYFYIDREEMLVDEEYSYEIRNFKVL